MKLSQKLLIAPVLTALVMVGLSLASTWLLQDSRVKSEQQVTVVIESLAVFTDAQDQLGRVHASAYRTVSLAAALDAAKFKTVKADIETQVSGVSRAITSAAEAAGEDEMVRKAAADVQKQLTAYTAKTLYALDLASGDPNTGAVEMQDPDAIFSSIGKSLGAIVARLNAQVSEKSAASRGRAQNLSNMLSLLGLLVAGAAVAFAMWMQGKVVAELRRAVAVANEVAAGNLQVDTASSMTDEVGDLMRALGRMCEQLNRAMTEVLSSSDSIRISSAEIASGTLDLSERTEQTASNLQRASVSTEQLTGTVSQSADSARQANQLASNAAEVAARGGKVVSQVVTTMEEINTSARKISDIIGVIDGIAFQTNILALNAAVEAARAGEHGRGFAVVAAEVRSLAQRSSLAAREIKTLIGDSTEKVDSGSKLVNDAGRTMQDILDSVNRVSRLITDIAQVGESQSGDIHQVHQAISQIDTMTQQNSALVEELAAAAQSLRGQSGRLSEAMSSFHVVA